MWYYWYVSVDYGNHNFFVTFYLPANHNTVLLSNGDWTNSSSSYFFDGDIAVSSSTTNLYLNGYKYGGN